jgi:hypothetical protein
VSAAKNIKNVSHNFCGRAIYSYSGGDISPIILTLFIDEEEAFSSKAL